VRASCHLLFLIPLACSTGFMPFEVFCEFYCTQLDHHLTMRTYHSSIFPYVGFSLGQVLLFIAYLLGGQSYSLMYTGFLISGGFSIENLDVWHWCECAEKLFGHFRPFPGHSDWKIWEVNFFFNSLSARLTNHPYMAFPNLEPPLNFIQILSFKFLNRSSNPNVHQ